MNLNKWGHPLLKIQVRYEPDIVTARQKTRRICELFRFDSQDQARVATAVSELARNIFQYANGGFIEFFFSDTEPQTLWIRVSDTGPGIADLGNILNGTYVSKSGMGVGLLGSKKLMDSFEIETQLGQGTKITIGKWIDKRVTPFRKESLPEIAEKLSSKHSDSPFEEIQNQNRDLLEALADLRTSKDELAELNRELTETNRGVVALYAELDEKAASLQRANEVKTSFLSNMTHEFRTPLSSVISLTRILLDRVDGSLTGEQEKQVQYIRKSSESLLELVNDLLDLAKVEAGKVTVHAAKFQVEELLSGLRGMFRPILGVGGPVEIQIEIQSGIQEMETDQAKLSQILRNLLSNAIKFTETGTVTLTARASDQDKVHFTVKDTGMGIDPKFMNVIFDDFSQLESKLQKNQKGTGLGLPLSRKLVNLLGGTIWAESTLGHGSTFHVVVPRKYSGQHEAVLFAPTSTAPTVESTQTSHLGNSQFRIVLIDDDEPSRYVLKNLLGQEVNAHFTEFSIGQDGLDFLKTSGADLLFLDLNMPGLDGMQILKVIRSDVGLSSLPVIINTARKLSEEEKIVLSREADAVLSKERTNQHLAIRDLRRALVKAGFDYKSM